jgi:hypothetical protein
VAIYDGSTIAEQWVARGQAAWIDRAISESFAAYLNSLSWHGATLDWARSGLPATEINIVTSSPEQLLDWFRTTSIGHHMNMLLVYSPTEPSLLVSAESGVAHLDELFWRSPGVHFCFGADPLDGGHRWAFADLLQYGVGDKLTATLAAA